MKAVESPASSIAPESTLYPRFANLFRADPLGAALFGGWLGPHWGEFAPIFDRMGQAGALAQPLSRSADRHRPELQRDAHTDAATGRGADRILYHPDTQRLEDLAYATGLVTRRNDLGFLVKHAARRNLVSVGCGYYFAQTEIGVMCQVCMTDGVGAILERHARNDLARSVLGRLGHAERRLRLRGAMFLSEAQGGSDIGTITTTARLVPPAGANGSARLVPSARENETARPDGGTWKLSGEKWFCSNVDAEAILTLARMPDAPGGTRGLGLFLILRGDPAGNGDTIRIQRLKHKLGVGSTPTGDVSLHDTEATLIAGANEGFKRMTELLNLTRLYNAAASLAGMRRGLLEALAHGTQRKAFGRKLWELPLWRAGMADLVAEHLGATALTFAAVRGLDASDAGDPTAMKEVRLLIPLAKAVTGKLAVFAVGECMEAMGGIGYLEDGILPRLLRDVSVLPIWEGTTNILTLDVARALVRERAHEAFFDRLSRAMAAAPDAPGVGEMRAAVEARMALDQQRLAILATASADDAQRAMREWLESAGRTATLAFLLELAALPDVTEPALAAFRRLQARPYAVMPLVASQAIALQDTEETLLRAGFAP
jgi:acyl-CoA dehydrogenase